MRLQKYMAMCGAASRRACEELIRQGRVTVNGHTVSEMGTQVEPGTDTVCLDGRELVVRDQHTYILMYKPAGVMTTCSDPQGRPAVLDLLKGVQARVVPVGRLDWDSEGLLLLTDDGDVVYRATHPSHEWDKGYRVQVFGIVKDAEAERLRKGVILDGRKTAPAGVEIEGYQDNQTQLLITIHEGRNRQVRRMCEAVGHPVRYLNRVRMGALTLDGLKSGQWRYLRDDEVAWLMAACGKTPTEVRE